MKSDMKYVLFTNESRATLDGPDGWAKGWVINGDQAPVRRRQQGGGGVMIWAGIIGDELIGPVRFPQGVKLTSATYCQFLKNVLEEWLEEVPLSQLKKVVFMHDNAPCHAAKASIKCLQGLGFKDETLMVWPPNSPDINPIENFYHEITTCVSIVWLLLCFSCAHRVFWWMLSRFFASTPSLLSVYFHMSNLTNTVVHTLLDEQ